MFANSPNYTLLKFEERMKCRIPNYANIHVPRCSNPLRSPPTFFLAATLNLVHVVHVLGRHGGIGRVPSSRPGPLAVEHAQFVEHGVVAHVLLGSQAAQDPVDGGDLSRGREERKWGHELGFLDSGRFEEGNVLL